MRAYEGLTTKDESSWVIPKVVTVANESVCLQEPFITKFKSQFSFTKVVLTRAGHLLEWSQGELSQLLFLKY